MEMWSLLAFGALVGMQHALEADHLAAVAALSARPSNRRSLMLRGAWWGAGHTIALFAICGSVLLLGLTLGDGLQASLEFAVGIMVAGLGLNVLVVGCVPILVTQSLLRLAQRRLPHNFFVYVYINGFLAAGLSTLAVGLLGALLMLMVDGGSSEWLSYQYYPFFPLIFFSEAFVNGMIMTALVALRPGWVSSFDDNLYINNK